MNFTLEECFEPEHVGYEDLLIALVRVLVISTLEFLSFTFFLKLLVSIYNLDIKFLIVYTFFKFNFKYKFRIDNIFKYFLYIYTKHLLIQNAFARQIKTMFYFWVEISRSLFWIRCILVLRCRCRVYFGVFWCFLV